MSDVQLLDLLTIAVVTVVWAVLAALMLRHVVFWTGLGRSLVAFFSVTALASAHGTAWRLLTGAQQPQWAGLVFRLPIVLAGLGILYFLWRYPWPLPSEGVRWLELLGMKRRDDETYL